MRELLYKARSVWQVSSLTDLSTAPIGISSGNYDFILFDIGLTGLFAPDLLNQIISPSSHPPVFILSREFGYPFFNFAISAGASGYFHIPYSISVLAGQIDRYFEASSFCRQPSGDDLVPEVLLQTILGKSALMQQLRTDILGFHLRTEPVLIYGETGSGKDLVAQMIHENSPVASGPFTIQNVSCITNSLAESILFGTSRGSFTGATESKGLFVDADHGTLFLDEIGELDLSLQPKFLRVLEDKKVSKVGSSISKKVEFRLICATNKSLSKAVDSGQFRKDLFHRLDVLRIEIPPLRSHAEDIPLLSSFKLKSYQKVLSANALEKLHSHKWPGNVRELFQCLSRAACSSKTDIIYQDQIRF